MKYRVTLGADDFEKLISGKIIETKRVQIILSDIGFHEMHKALSKAMENHAATIPTDAN